MVVGIGTDLVEVARIERLWVQRPQAFAARILNGLENDVFQKQSLPARWLAKRWAAKEAVVKALGTGFSNGVSFQDLTILNTPQGKPTVVLSGRALEVAQSLGITHWSISISDEAHYALAFAVAEAHLPS